MFKELCVESFIPNDINLSLDDYRILLLTGANAAGSIFVVVYHK